jgi:MscS family membrane protein
MHRMSIALLRAKTCLPWLVSLLLTLSLTAMRVTAQDQEPAAAATPELPAVAAAYNSPRSTLRTFLEAMRGETPDKDAGVACMDISQITADGAPDVALKLYKCINRIEMVSWNDSSILDEERVRAKGITAWEFFPRQADRVGLGAQLARERARLLSEVAPNARIVLSRQPDGAWRFTAETVAGVESLWDQIQDLQPVTIFPIQEARTTAERIEALFGQPLKQRFLEVKYWQWISIFVLIFVGVVLDFSVRLLLTAISRRVIRRQRGEARRETLKRTVRPFGLAVAAMFWLWVVGFLDLPDVALRIVMPAIRLFAMLAGVWAAYRLTDLVGEVATSKAETTDTKFDDLLVPLVRKSVKVFITIFGLIYIANSLDVPIAPLLTGLGIGGAGFAFAAKDTLEHFFGSITVIADRPFQVGDWVMIGDVEGTVEEVGFRSTRIRTFYNSLTSVPNGNLVRAVVDNFGRRKYRRWKTHLTITYDTPPDTIEAFCEGIRQIIRQHPYTRKDYYQVWLHQFGAHSLDVLVYMFHEAPDWQTELRERHRLMLDVMRLADRLGVQFAFPTQTLHVHQEAAEQLHEPAETPDTHAEARAVREGRKAADEIMANAAWRRAKPGPYVFRHATGDDDDEDTQIESKIGGDA